MPDKESPMFDPERIKFEFYPFTAREALLEIRRIAETGPSSIETEMIDQVAKVGLDAPGMENYETTDRLADRLAEAHALLGQLRKPEHESLLGDIDGVLVLPPDLEAMIDRRLGADREKPESAEQVRLQLSDILIEGRAQVLRKLAAEEKPRVRTVLGEVDELIQAMFERFAPERWAEELAKFEEIEARVEEARGEDEEAVEVMAKALADGVTAPTWERADNATKMLWRQRARNALEAYGELGRERESSREGDQ